MPIGAGLAPAGLAPAGFGVPETVAATPTSPLPDPTTGLPLTGRLIDPTKGDYVMQPDGRLQGMTTVQQLVLLAVLGIDFTGLDEKGPGFDNAVRGRIQAGLADLVAGKQVAIRSIAVDSSVGDGVTGAVHWVDLTTGAPGQTPFGQ